MDAALRKDALSETFIDVERLLYDVCHRFRRRYGIRDFDELRSEANLLFLKAHERYNGRSKFSAWLYRTIWTGLFDRFVRAERSREYLCPRVPFDFDVPLEVRSSFDFDSLSDDAKDIVRLVRDTPRELANSLMDGKRSGPKARKCLASLLHDLGYSTQHIAETFEEIRRALA